jgi:spore germination protein YaaH
MPIAPAPVILPPPVNTGSKPLAIAFCINWDESSYASLQRNLNHLDWLVPQWVHLQDPAGSAGPIGTELDPPALDLIRETRPQIRIFPMVQNLVNDQWNSDYLVRSLADEQSRQRLVSALTTFVDQYKFSGVCIDFEELPTASQPNLLKFMQTLHAAFQVRNLVVMQAVPFDSEEWDYKQYAAANDYLMLMAYDQHYAGKDAGSVAAQDWYERNLTARMKEIDPQKAIIAIGNYGYDWTRDSKESAKEVTFQEAAIIARESEATPLWDQGTLNPYFEYDEEDQSHHTVWFLDGVTAYNQMRAASGYKPAGFALWRLGSEDPSIWSIFGSSQTSFSADSLRKIVHGYRSTFRETASY